MKKNYFMLVCLVLLWAFSAKAQVNSVSSLFGEYKFTADVEFASEDYKNSYGSVIVSESDVTIGEDPYRIYDGAVFGFAGSSKALRFNFSNNTLEPMNIRDVTLGDGLLFADIDANNPYGVNINGSYVAYSPYYAYNPTTKEIVIPDFTVVTVANPGSDEKGTLIATYKNAKLAYVGGDEEDSDASAFEWAGTHTLTAANVTAYDGKEYPASFDVTIVKDDAGYLVTNVMGYDVTGLNNGGIAFTVAADGKSAQMTTGSYLYGAHPDYIVIQDMNASKTPINLVLQKDGSVKVDDIFLQGLNYNTNETTPLAFYQGVTIAAAGGSEPEESAFSWVGQHTVKVGTIESYDSKSYPSEFTMTVIEDGGEHIVTEFFSTDVTAINNGGIEFVVAADGKSAQMAVSSFVGGAYPDYLVICDMNAGESPIRFILNDDGSVAIDNFYVKTCNFDSGVETPAALFKDVTIPATGGSEPEEPETPAFDWAGTYTFNGTPNSKDGSEYPATFEVVVTFNEANEYQGASYTVTSFMGNDVNAINYGGGIELTIAEDGKSATLANGNVKSFGGGLFLKLFDVNATANPIAITLNEDGTLSMADFSVVMGNWGDNENNTLVAWYQNAVLTKGGEAVEPETPAGPQYRVKCDNGYLNVYSTYAYPTGPVGGVNVVEYAEDNNQIFTIEDAGDGNVYLKSVSGYYIYCQSWNVDGNANEKSALTFEEAADGKFYIKCSKGYFKVEYVSNTPVATIDGVQIDQPAISGYFPYCDAPVTAAALWSLEEVGGSTGIENVKVENGNVKGIFDVQGRKVEQIVAPGLYIIDGKKVFVK